MKLINYCLFAVAIIFAIYIGSDIPDFNIISQFILIFPIFYLIFINHKNIGIYKTYYIYTVFYTLGYVIYLYVMYLTRDNYTVGGWMGIGNFDFRGEQLDMLSYSAFSLMCGLYLGSKLIYLFDKKTDPYLVNRSLFAIDINYLKFYVNLWIYLSIFLIAFMAFFGIGRTGLQDSVTLPFGVRGFMFYARVIILPLLGFYFLEISIISGDKLLLNKILRWMLIFAILIGTLFFSRSDIVMILLPLSLYLAVHDNEHIRKYSKKFFIKIFIIIVIGTQIVQFSRNIFYADTSMGFEMSDVDAVIDRTDLNSTIENLVVLATIRQGGARDMAVALNSSYNSIDYVWNFFWQIGEDGFMTDVWGFEPEAFNQDGKSYGTGFNGFGWYGFGKNLFLIFTLAALTGVFSCWIESIFVKKGLVAAQFFIAFLISLMLWNSFVWGRAWRVVPMIFLAAYIINKMDKKIFKSDPITVKYEI